MRRQMLRGSFIKAASFFLLFITWSGSGKADLIPTGMPPTFMPSPSPACSPVTGTFCIGFSDKDMLIRQEALDNGAEIQDFTITFLGTGMPDNTITSTDGIVTSVILKPAKDKLISFTTADDGKTKDGFMLTVLGPNKWNVKGVKNTPFIQMVETKGFFQVPGDKKIKLTETLQPKGGPKVTGNGVLPGKIADPLVVFVNDSRNGDRVVSGQVKKEDIPGGIKELKLNTMGRQVELGIERMAGAAGSAEFVKVDAKGMPVKKPNGEFELIGNKINNFTGDGTEKSAIIIFGLDISDRPRNMAIIAREKKDKEKKDIVGCFTFTVFRVESRAFFGQDEKIKTIDKIPGFDKAANFTKPKGNPLTDIYDKGTTGFTELGAQLVGDTNQAAYGGIVFRGMIVPTNIPKEDFNRAHNRFESFNWDRRRSTRIYDKQGCFLFITTITAVAGHDVSDDSKDLDEDLTADPDVATMTNDLFVWSLDTPRFVFDNFKKDGDIIRSRWQFREQLFYAKVQVSQAIPWYWRTSLRRENKKLVLVKDASGDDEVLAGSGVTTLLTPDLKASNVPVPTVTAFSPADADIGKLDIKWSITGTNLAGGKDCQRVAYLVLESPFVDHLNVDPIVLEITKSTATMWEGTFNTTVPDPGDYKLKVVIFDKAITLGTVKIK